MLDLRRLRVLREVAEQGSFSAAAETLYVSQSAVSQQIAALEAEVGTSLLLRLRDGPILTEAGELLVGHADAAIARLEEAERELAELSGLGSGELRLISFPSASATLVTQAASLFRDRHPEIRLSLSEADPEDSIPELKRGRHDVAVVYDFELNPLAADRDLVLRPLLEERMHIAIDRNHRLADRGSLALSELAGEPWLCGLTNGSCRELTLRTCQQAGFDPDIAFESDDYNVMQGLIAAGLGVTLLPDLTLTQPHPGITLLEIEPEAPVRRVWAATLTAGSRSRATDAMVETLEQVGVEFAARAPALAA